MTTSTKKATTTPANTEATTPVAKKTTSVKKVDKKVTMKTKSKAPATKKATVPHIAEVLPHVNKAASAIKATPEVQNESKVKGKEVIVNNAAILPIVSSKTKEVFLKVVKKNADAAVLQIEESIEEGRFTGLGNELKQFVREHDTVKVWSSKAARIRAGHLEKSQGTQVEFWKRSGFTIVNLEQMVEDMKKFAAETTVAEQTKEAKAVKTASKAAAKKTTKEHPVAAH